VPLRAAPLFAAAVTVTLPLPVPLAGPVIVSHGAFDVALHEHVAPVALVAVIAVVALPPSGGALPLAGEIANVHGGGGAVCVIVSVRPATVMFPDRSPPPLAATLKATEPSPVPEVAPSAIHGAALDAVHAQPACDPAIATVPLPPADGKDCADGVTVKVHGGGAAACVTANVWPAIVTMPLRSLVEVFAATSRRTVPLPFPFAPAPTTIHGTLDAAVQGHPAPAVTDAVTDPPLDATRALVADSVKAHGGGGGAGGGAGGGSGEGGGAGDGEGAGGARPACVTTTDCSAMCTVAERGDGSAFGAARSVTDPLTDALIAPAAVSHGASLAAVQAHPFNVSIAIVTDPPAAGTAALAGDTV